MVWKMADETASQKFKEKLSVDNVLATIFWYHKGVLLLKNCVKRSTETSASYFDTLIHLQNAIKTKRPGLLK